MTISGYLRGLAACTFLSALFLNAKAGEDQTLYPFVLGEKWGYINSSGDWVVEPKFDRCAELFTGDRVLVWQNHKWGYIDRTGSWIVKPEFEQSFTGKSSNGFAIVAAEEKQGIFAESGKLVLPTIYDEIVLFQDRAWVRTGKKLGIYLLTGDWLLKPSLDWPKDREMPIPTLCGVSWFKQDDKWGVLSREGKTLFKPIFAEHELGRREAVEWTHPEGLDFDKLGRAWVVVGKNYWLITDEGKVLAREPFQIVRPWANGLYLFTAENGLQGLISKEGKIAVRPRYAEISDPQEGMAVCSELHTKKTEGGEIENWWTYGYMDEHGKMVIKPGIYAGPGREGGGQVELAPFSEGLAPVWNNSPRAVKDQVSDPCAGYIDRTGALVIPEQFSES